MLHLLFVLVNSFSTQSFFRIQQPCQVIPASPSVVTMDTGTLLHSIDIQQISTTLEQSGKTCHLFIAVNPKGLCHLDVQHSPIVQTPVRRHGEMAYTADSKSAVREDVWVQVPLPAVETRQQGLRPFDGFPFWQWGAGGYAR